MAECKACGAWFGTVSPQDLCPTCERALKRLGVYVAPVRHAHRVDNGGFYYSCSECGGSLTYGGNYCPNCGAKMDGGADNA